MNVRFLGGVDEQLTLGQSASYHGSLSILTGRGDTADLFDIRFSPSHNSYNPTTRTLNVSDGTHTAEIKITGTTHYTGNNFSFSTDHHGGTLDSSKTQQTDAHSGGGETAAKLLADDERRGPAAGHRKQDEARPCGCGDSADWRRPGDCGHQAKGGLVMRSSCMRFVAAAAAGVLSIAAPPAWADGWIGSWGASDVFPVGPDVNYQTLRQFVRLSAGGKRVRIRFSNATGQYPLVIGAAHVAKPAADGAAGAIDPATDHVLTFGGPARSPWRQARRWSRIRSRWNFPRSRRWRSALLSRAGRARQ